MGWTLLLQDLEVNAFEDEVIDKFIGMSMAEYKKIKEKSHEDMDSADPIAMALDEAHINEGATADKGKFLYLCVLSHVPNQFGCELFD
jgi:hypothetical protein